MFEIIIFLKKISQTSFWVLPYFSKYHISQVLRVLSMRNIPSWPSGQALFEGKVWMTPLFKCLSYVENKNVREKKIKKITHIKNFFIFVSFCSCLRSRDLKISARSDYAEFSPFLYPGITRDHDDRKQNRVYLADRMVNLMTSVQISTSYPLRWPRYGCQTNTG